MARTRGSFPYRAMLALLGAWALAAAACGGGSPDGGLSPEESVLRVAIPGTTGGDTSTAPDGTITKLFDVTGDWSQVSIDLAKIVQAEGWTIFALNCVGTGNDVIAKRRAGDEWLLLESGAGGRGAGMIVRHDPAQAPPARLTVTGRCPEALVSAVE